MPHREARSGRGAASSSTTDDRKPTQLRRQLRRVADGRAREAEHGIRAIVRAQSTEATQHVCDVAAEQPAQHVQLVDDDVAKAHEERRPLAVRRQDPDVEHLGVGEDRRSRSRVPTLVRRAACRRRRWRRPARATAIRAAFAAGPAPGPWWGTRAARCPGSPRATDSTIGQLVAERLPRRGAGGQHDAATVAQEVDGARLMFPERGDPRCGSRHDRNSGDSPSAGSAKRAPRPGTRDVETTRSAS